MEKINHPRICLGCMSVTCIQISLEKLILHKSFSLKIGLSSFYIFINFMLTNKDINLSL